MNIKKEYEYDLTQEDMCALLAIAKRRDEFKLAKRKYSYRVEELEVLRDLLSRGASLYHISELTRIAGPNITLTLFLAEGKGKPRRVSTEKSFMVGREELAKSIKGSTLSLSLHSEGLTNDDIAELLSFPLKTIISAQEYYNEWKTFNLDNISTLEGYKDSLYLLSKQALNNSKKIVYEFEHALMLNLLLRAGEKITRLSKRVGRNRSGLAWVDCELLTMLDLYKLEGVCIF